MKLDPVDLSPARNPGLKLNTELQTAPSGSADERKAASELWAALNTPPEKAAEDAKRLGAMEADLKALREQQASLQASVAALTTQLQAERAEREASAPKMLVYALGAALALVLAALAWLLAERRRERSQRTLGEAPWWESEAGMRGEPAPAAPPGFSAAPAAPIVAPMAAPAATAAAAATLLAPAASVLEDDSVGALDVSEATESSFTEVIDDSPVSMDVLLDLVQEVEFFESLQQQGHASQLLEQFVEAHPTACELPYLLLLQQAQALGQTERLTELGARYQQTFGMPAPEALCYTAGQAGLDTQAKFMDILTRFWPEEQVLGLLQNTLLATPGTGLLEKRSLQAFEDALLLYSVAHTLQNDPGLHAPAAVQAGLAAGSDASDPAATANVFNSAAALNAPLAARGLLAAAAPGSADAALAAPSPQARAAVDLDLDLSFATEHDIPPSAGPPAANTLVDDSKGGRDLPMLDFDLFAIDVPKKDEPPAKT